MKHSTDSATPFENDPARLPLALNPFEDLGLMRDHADSGPAAEFLGDYCQEPAQP